MGNENVGRPAAGGSMAMTQTKRVSILLLMVACGPLLMTASGNGFVVSRPVPIVATIVVDPHNAPATPTARQATIYLEVTSPRRQTTGAVFNVPPSFPL